MFGKNNLENLTINDVRHAVLKGIMYFNHRFSKDYGRMVLCFDSTNYWRTKEFKHYKAARKKKQKSGDIDWGRIYGFFSVVKEEISENTSFLTMQIPTLEADDIISTICEGYHDKEKILIVSSDKDFQQLQKYDNVKQYSPAHRDFIVCEDPEHFLIEHIIRGDSSDGIPNVMSDGDTFVTEDKKQKIMNAKRFNAILDKVNDGSVYDSDYEYNENYERNERLIDLSLIPAGSKTSVVNAFEMEKSISNKREDSMMDYLISNNLKSLLEELDKFGQKIEI